MTSSDRCGPGWTKGKPMQANDLVAPRKAALLIHALPERARKTVLHRLTPAEREQMETLLSEIHLLGIPTGRDWLALMARPRLKDDSPRDMLMKADVEQLAPILLTQAPSTIATVLHLGSWPWKDAFLAKAPADTLLEIQWHLAERPRLSRHVTDMLERQLADSVASHRADQRTAPHAGHATRMAAP